MRCAAENKLIQLRIIRKLQYDQELSQWEAKYLQQWMQNPDAVSLCFTDKPISQLSQRDQDLLNRFRYSQVPKYGEFSLSDFVVEYAQMYNQSLINAVVQ